LRARHDELGRGALRLYDLLESCGHLESVEARERSKAETEVSLLRDMHEQLMTEAASNRVELSRLEADLPVMRHELDERELIVRELKGYAGMPGHHTSGHDLDTSLFTGDEGIPSLPVSPSELSFTGADGMTSDVQSLRRQVDRCKSWITQMRQSGEEINTQIQRLRSKEASYIVLEADCEALGSQILSLERENAHMSSENIKLMDLSNAMRARLSRAPAGSQVQALPEPAPSVDLAVLEARRSRRRGVLRDGLGWAQAGIEEAVPLLMTSMQSTGDNERYEATRGGLGL